MAVNSSRSMNDNLREGATDGKYRKARPNTAVDAAPAASTIATSRDRESLHAFAGYGFVNSEYPAAARTDVTRV